MIVTTDDLMLLSHRFHRRPTFRHHTPLYDDRPLSRSRTCAFIVALHYPIKSPHLAGLSAVRSSLNELRQRYPKSDLHLRNIIYSIGRGC